MPTALFLALANPTSPDVAPEFARWYLEHHIPDLLRAVPGIKAATRYELTDVEMLPGLPKLEHQSIAVYEVEAESEADLAAVADARA